LAALEWSVASRTDVRLARIPHVAGIGASGATKRRTRAGACARARAPVEGERARPALERLAVLDGPFVGGALDDRRGCADRNGVVGVEAGADRREDEQVLREPGGLLRQQERDGLVRRSA
jgi:hypothetical protein